MNVRLFRYATPILLLAGLTPFLPAEAAIPDPAGAKTFVAAIYRDYETDGSFPQGQDDRGSWLRTLGLTGPVTSDMNGSGRRAGC